MTPLVSLISECLSACTVLAGFLFLALIFIPAVRAWFGRRALLVSFLLALGGVAGSLFYSEIAGFAPCLLCWWQRIFLYPQAVIFLIGFLKKDSRALLYGVWLSVLALPFALYSAYLQFGGLPLGNCSAAGVSCSIRYFLEFGYVTIPTMSLTLFALLIALFFAGRRLDGEMK